MGEQYIVEFFGGPFDGQLRAYPDLPKPRIEVPLFIRGVRMTGVYELFTRTKARWIAPKGIDWGSARCGH